MKHLLPYSFLLLPVLFSCDDFDTISDKQEESFIKFYGGGLEDEGMKVLNTSEGYLVMGNILNTDLRKGHDICVIFTDKYGNTTKPIKVYGGEFDDFGYSIEKTDDGYVIVGSTVIERGDKQIYLIKIDQEGDTLLTREFGDEYDDEAYDIIVRDDGNLVMCGYTEVNEVNKDFIAISTDANGNLIQPYQRGLAIESEVALSLVQAGSRYLIAGYSYGSTEANRSGLAVIWDGESSATPQPFNIGLHTQINAICSDGEGGYYLACTVQPNPSNLSEIYIVKIGSDLQEEWRKPFGEKARSIVRDIAIFGNSIFLVGTSSDIAGTSSDADLTGDMLILKTNLSGENPEYFYVGDGSSYQGYGFNIASDGGYIITGSNHLNTINSTITLCKLTSEGTIDDI